MIKRNIVLRKSLVIVTILLFIGASVLILPFFSSTSLALIASNKINNENAPQYMGPEMEITTDKILYNLGEPVVIFLTNIGDEILSAGGPIITIYNDANEIVYQEGCYCWWELEPGEYIEWPPWDQTDKNGVQVPTGEYLVEGFLSGYVEEYIDTVTFYIIDDDFPDPPSGPTEGIINVDYIFCIELPDMPECEPYYLMWDFGDGFSTDWLGPYPSGEIICIDHSWLSPGIYNIKVKIKHGCGNDAWSSPLTIHIYNNNAPKAPVIKGPSNPKVGRECHYIIKAEDIDGDDISYYVNLGNGVIINWTECWPNEDDLHVYPVWNEEGTYTIKTKARDCPWGVEGPESSLTITISTSRTIDSYLQKIFSDFTNFFPILKLLLRLIV